MRRILKVSGSQIYRLFSRARSVKTTLRKRERFIVAAGLESVVYLLASTVQSSGFWPTFVTSLGSVGALTLWALWEELSDIKYGIILVLPVFLFGSQVFFVRMLEPQVTLTILSTLLYAVGAYSLLLTQNIYNVAAVRTIQLLRAANAVGFAFTLICAFFIFAVIWGSRPHPVILALLVGILSLPLILQSLWGVDLEERISRRLFGIGVFLALIVAEISFAFALWPILPTIGALSIVVALYVLLGLFHYHLSQKLLKRTVWEYTGVAVAVMTIILLTTKWGA